MGFRDYKTRECDVLVIGGGGSGALASIEASEQEGLKVILASKGPVGQSGLTPTANGGTKGGGFADGLFQDMVTAGCFMNDQDIVWFLLDQIPGSLDKLKHLGVPVTPLQGKTVCVPGPQALKKLRAHILKRPNIELLEDVLMTRLLKTDDKVSGATALDLATGEFSIVKAGAVVIATGGVTGELYPHTSNNPFGVTTDASGTGHIMSCLAGAELIDMEMIQFVPLPAHPRALHLRYFPDFWVGPYTNRFGEVFESDIKSYRDESYSYVFVQKLFKEMEKGNGPIYIDQRNVEQPAPSLAIKSWDQRRKRITSLGIDPRENRIEIIIGSHFCMGGIRVNSRTETTLAGLYAAGEVMGGVHGAMRLSGCSFAQMIVFGFEAGKQAARYVLRGANPGEASIEDVEDERERVFRFLEPKHAPLSVAELKKRLQRVMEEHVFVVRDKAGLEEAIRQVSAVRNDVSRLSVPDFRKFNLEWTRAIEFSLMTEAADIIARSALAREESRGVHHRRDFPGEDNVQWLKHTVAKLDKGRLSIGSAPVGLDHMGPMV